MTYAELIGESSRQFRNRGRQVEHAVSMHVFRNGARWMNEELNRLTPSRVVPFDKQTRYNLYGMLKYGICLAFFFGSFFLFLKFSVYTTPLSVVVFYFVEVHFLFLFPLLIDKVENPIFTSIRQTYQTGIVKAVFTVMPIGFFMIRGLLNLKNPFENWHIGCLSIVIWYQYEIRDRVSPRL